MLLISSDRSDTISQSDILANVKVFGIISPVVLIRKNIRSLSSATFKFFTNNT